VESRDGDGVEYEPVYSGENVIYSLNNFLGGGEARISAKSLESLLRLNRPCRVLENLIGG